MPRHKNSKEPTRPVGRRTGEGPVSLEVAAFRSLLIAKNILVQEDDKWDPELEHFVAESYRRIFDMGAKSAVESTNRVRQLEDTVDERERRIAQLEREVTALHKELRAYKKGAR